MNSQKPAVGVRIPAAGVPVVCLRVYVLAGAWPTCSLFLYRADSEKKQAGQTNKAIRLFFFFNKIDTYKRARGE